MNKVSIYCGISASGKSTHAKKQAATVIERDEIRKFLFPGYEMQAPDSKKENLVTQEQERQILGAIKAGKEHIIISDTNLNQKYVDRILSLFEPVQHSLSTSYSINFEYFDDSLDYELCLQRNAARERKVPEDVLIKQWKRYQVLRNQHNNYRFDTSQKPVLFVSDVHGLYGKFWNVISKYVDDYTIILSGDLNDQRFDLLEDNFSIGVTSSGCLLFTKNCKDLGYDVHLLHSNHQKNFVNICRGKRKKLTQGLQNTAAEFTWEGLVLEFDDEKSDDSTIWLKNSYLDDSFNGETTRGLVNFLDTRPSCYAMNHNGQEWRFAHAYTPSCQIEFNPFPAKDELYIYGPTRPEGNRERLQWWFERENQNVGFKSCIGHVHTTFMGKNSVVCDPDDINTLGLVFFEDGQEPRMEFV
jgi:predicted kinase